jgi:predicted nucleic acid-binding protein
MSGPLPPATEDLVSDAGVAIKWSVPEVLEAGAKLVLAPAYSLHVPELFLAEFGNILSKTDRILKVPELTVEKVAESWVSR